MDKKNTYKIVANNKKAYHDYFIEEELECGIVLKGNEVKSIKNGKVSIKESWVAIENGEMFIKKMHVTRWDTANVFDAPDETRERKLLANKKEIAKLAGQIKLMGYTIVPLSVYLVDGKVKVKIGLAKGKHNYDKRNDAKVKAMKRESERYA